MSNLCNYNVSDSEPEQSEASAEGTRGAFYILYFISIYVINDNYRSYVGAIPTNDNYILYAKILSN